MDDGDPSAGANTYCLLGCISRKQSSQDLDPGPLTEDVDTPTGGLTHSIMESIPSVLSYDMDICRSEIPG